MTTKLFIHLPLEVLVNIVIQLKLNDIRNLMMTCKTLNNLIMTESIFLRLIFRNKFMLQSRSSQQNTYSWYNRCRISQHWSKGIFKNRIIIRHVSNYMPWLQLVNSDTLYLSVGSELQCYTINQKGLGPCKYLWSKDVLTVERNDIRTNDISRFVVKDDVIVCGNRDGSVSVYKLGNRDGLGPELVMHNQNCHDNGTVEVSAVEIIKNSIITISQNNPQVCFWNYNNYGNDGMMINDKLYSRYILECNHQSRNINIPNEIGCRCVSVNKSEDTLAVGLNGNSKPILLDVNTGSLLMTSEQTRDSRHLVRDIQWHDENSIVCVSHSGKLQLIDVRSHNVVYESTDPFLSSLYCVKTDSNRAVVVGSSEYSRCVLFDLRSIHHVQMYFTQKKSSCIYSLDFDSTRLIAAADRGVAALNFNVNSSSTQIRDYSHAFEPQLASKLAFPSLLAVYRSQVKSGQYCILLKLYIFEWQLNLDLE